MNFIYFLAFVFGLGRRITLHAAVAVAPAHCPVKDFYFSKFVLFQAWFRLEREVAKWKSFAVACGYDDLVLNSACFGQSHRLPALRLVSEKAVKYV